MKKKVDQMAKNCQFFSSLKSETRRALNKIRCDLASMGKKYFDSLHPRPRLRPPTSNLAPTPQHLSLQLSFAFISVKGVIQIQASLIFVSKYFFFRLHKKRQGPVIQSSIAIALLKHRLQSNHHHQLIYPHNTNNKLLLLSENHSDQSKPTNN